MRNLEKVARSICDSTNLGLIKSVGEGSHKETFQVMDANGDSYALKIVDSANTSNARIERELESMMKCNHISIAKILRSERIEIEGTQYLFLIEDFFSGGTLWQACKQAKHKLSRSMILTVGHQLISAITHLKDLELVHRDIKPQNILLKRSGSHDVALTDFGIVRSLDDSSLTNTWVNSGPCTPRFASPEQLTNQKHMIDWRSDQFCLGISLSICALGYHPYESIENLDVTEIVASKKEPSNKFKADIHTLNLPVLEKMIQPWPANRYRVPNELSLDWAKQGV